MTADRLAFDRASVRTMDVDGRLHVAVSNISMAAVNEYLGSEIPDAEVLGLDPNKRYALLRDPDELAKAAATFNNLPILSQHVPVSAADHRPELVIGSTGTDAAFVAPYLQNSLVFWSAAAIEGIESGEQRELSSAYRYRAVMEPGEYEGVKFHGRMVDLAGNHLAAVPVGRAGPTVVVGDSALPTTEKDNTMPKRPASALTHRAGLLAAGALRAYLKPKIAQDAKPVDVVKLLRDVTAANWKAKKPGLVNALNSSVIGKLAQDADISDVVELLDQLDDEVSELADTDVIPPPAEDDDGDDVAMDDDLMAKVKAILGPDADDEKCKALCALLKPAAAMDEPPATPGTPEPPSKDKPDAITKGAMDAAMRVVREQTKRETVAHMNAIAEATRIVRPLVGEIVAAMDSAAQVYKLALDAANVDLTGVPEAAYPALVRMLPKPGDTPAKPTRIAADAASTESFKKLFPDAPRVRHL